MKVAGALEGKGLSESELVGSRSNSIIAREFKTADTYYEDSLYDLSGREVLYLSLVYRLGVKGLSY